MPRLDKRPSVHNLKVETYSTAPAMPSPFQKVFGSLQQSLGRYRATFDTVATPNPISSVSGCGSSQADLTKLNPSKNAAISLLAKAHIQKIKDKWRKVLLKVEQKKNSLLKMTKEELRVFKLFKNVKKSSSVMGYSVLFYN